MIACPVNITSEVLVSIHSQWRKNAYRWNLLSQSRRTVVVAICEAVQVTLQPRALQMAAQAQRWAVVLRGDQDSYRQPSIPSHMQCSSSKTVSLNSSVFNVFICLHKRQEE